jgi:hypothetical protein
MKKCFLAMAVCLFTATFCEAQTAAKSVFAEIGGPGLASINFDTRFQKKNGGFGGRIGIGGFSLGDFSVLTVPIGANYLLSKDDRNFFELGAGVTYVNASEDGYDDDNFSSTFGHLSIGYRLQPANGGFQFRAAITPIFGEFGFLPYYAGISFGYKF